MHNDSGRVYVGQTSMPVDLRLQCHYRPSSPCLHIRRAIQKYGASAFTNYELAHGLSKEEADALEVALIREHDSTRSGFNISLGGIRGPRRNVCKRGHDLSLPDARRADPVWWTKQLSYIRDYKRTWRAARQLQAA